MSMGHPKDVPYFSVPIEGTGANLMFIHPLLQMGRHIHDQDMAHCLEHYHSEARDIDIEFVSDITPDTTDDPVRNA